MADVFLERTFEPPLQREHVLQMAVEGAGCFSLHQVDWNGSLLSLDGRRMVCWFSAPDTESARTALRQAGADTRVLWPGTIHIVAAASGPREPRVLVERDFDQPVMMEAVQAVENAGAWCLEAHGVTFLRSFFSRSRQRMLCLYHAADAESVRLAQHQAGMPVSGVWACRYVHPLHTEPPPA